MSLWDRNFQMAFWSIVFGCVTLFYDSSYMIENGGFFGGWTMNTWILVFLWGIGGILVAITIKYTDVIIKGFASAISLIGISIAGSMLLGDDLDLIFGLGAIITIIATFNYNEQEQKSAASLKSSSTTNQMINQTRGQGENGSPPRDTSPMLNSRDMLTPGGGGNGSRNQSLDTGIDMVNQTNVSVSINIHYIFLIHFLLCCDLFLCAISYVVCQKVV